MGPTLNDFELDQLLQSVRKDHKLPPGVVFAGEFNDGFLLHVTMANGALTAETDAPFTNEFCIRAKPERTDGRKWALVPPLFLTRI